MHVIVTGQSLRRTGLGGHVSSEVQGQSCFPEQQMIYIWSLQVAEITVSALSTCSSYGLVRGFFCLILGLPIQVRDAGLSLKDEMPKSDVNKEYYTQNMEREVSVASHDHAFWMAVCGEERAAMT